VSRAPAPDATAGITAYGAYIPPTRLSLAAIGGQHAVEGGAEKAVAWNDEDAVTMAVAAAANCLEGTPRESVDALFFASTSYGFREKQAAALIARALDLRRDLDTADFGGSLRAGTTALRAAFDSVAAGSARTVLVIASDCRMAAPGSPLERNLGDGAAAFLVGADDVMAEFEGAFTLSEEILDVWRGDGESFSHSWEDRFVVQEGYTPRIVEAVTGLLERLGRSLDDYAKVVLYGPDARAHKGAARALKLDATRLQEAYFGRLGNAGVAFAPLLLAAALEGAKPGERLLVANYGDGAEALGLRIADAAAKLGERRGVTHQLARRRNAGSYAKYLRARDLENSEWEAGSDPGLSATIHFRERDDDLSFRAQRCRACDAVQFPAQRICESCFAKDDFATLRLSDRVGRVVTYTFDHFFPTPDPPTVVTILDVEGARIHMQLVDCAPEQVSLGMPVEFVFRCIHRGGGRPNYYWKGRPCQDG